VASRTSNTLGVKVDHQAIAAATAAAAQHELKRAGALGERMLRIWQYAIGDEDVRGELEIALNGLEAAVGIDHTGRVLRKDQGDDDDKTAGESDSADKPAPVDF
jgi:hypothetical protein